MGLPRYLQDKYDKIINEEIILKHKDYIRIGMFICSDLRCFNRIDDECTINNSLLKFGIKRLYYGTREGDIMFWIKNKKYQNLFEKEEIKYYTFHEKINGKWYCHYKNLEVNSYFEEKAIEILNSKKDKEWSTIKKREELENIKNIEQGRTFKGRLRQMILERDNYKCVLCGKSAKDNIKLEIDHIKPWEDGGKTIYDNGRTVCSDCNKGLHHFKRYKEKESAFLNICKLPMKSPHP